MKTKTRNPESVSGDRNVESLYQAFLDAFYQREDRQAALALAPGLEAALQADPEYAGTIRSEEILSLIAEARGDYQEAIRRREAEIRKILELHSMSYGSPSWKYVSEQYDFRDVSDRLDLLAMLYDNQGDPDRARAILGESKLYCQAHKIPFDGEDLLQELEQSPDLASGESNNQTLRSQTLDEAIVQVYPLFNTSADEILSDDDLARQFADRVIQSLPKGTDVTLKAIKKRLLTLRRRGAGKGGLPRLRG